jgi:hypothetical protein
MTLDGTYESRYIIHFVGNLAGENPRVYVNLSPGYEYRKYVENRK